jgi:hypothetical protein
MHDRIIAVAKSGLTGYSTSVAGHRGRLQVNNSLRFITNLKRIIKSSLYRISTGEEQGLDSDSGANEKFIYF